MKFGVFDHVDDSGECLKEHLENRLKIIEVYDQDDNLVNSDRQIRPDQQTALSDPELDAVLSRMGW